MDGTVGIVKVDSDGTTNYYISGVAGNNEEWDKRYIADWGAKFPAQVGDLLFNNSCVMYEDKVLYGDRKSLDFVGNLIKHWSMSAPPRKSARIK